MSRITDGAFDAIVLAAGRGTRMGTAYGALPKVLVPLCGHPVLGYVLDALAQVGITRPVVVVSPGSDAHIRAEFGNRCRYVLQHEQLGSGDAVRMALPEVGACDDVLVMCGDSPLFRVETVRALMAAHIDEGACISLTSAMPEDPSGYGRILRDSVGEVCGIAEEKMATSEQKAIREVNGGCYAFDLAWLRDNSGSMRRNEVGEYCLTEMVDIAIAQGRRVIAVRAGADEIAGINTPEQLAEAEAVLRSRGECG